LEHLDLQMTDQKNVKIEIKMPFIITIDGPAASGKSSVSRELARRYGWSWVSTGAFYRGLAYVAHHKGTDMTNEDALVGVAHAPFWKILMTSESTHVILDGADITEEVGREETGSLASKISSFAKVRKALLDAQRKCAVGVHGLVAEGRDCGTVVFPQAPVKIYLTARAEDRAARRALEQGRDLSQLVNEQKVRDAQDANRKAAPMQAPADAHVIDTTEYTLLEVVDRVAEHVEQYIETLKATSKQDI
jgi:cytidylate kinase